jgi:hypothetical protein
MIYWAVKSHAEAKVAVAGLNMKRLTDINRFQVFKSENAVLTVTGGGEIASAAAVSRLLTLFKPAPNDVFAQLGVVENAERDVIIYNKVTGRERSCYSDIVFAHNFAEGELDDADAAAIFQAAAIYMPPHAVFAIGVRNAPEAFGSAAEWLLNAERAKPIPGVLDEKEQTAFENVCAALKLSGAMRAGLRKAAARAAARGTTGLAETLERFALRVPCDKAERRRAYELLLNALALKL